MSWQNCVGPASASSVRAQSPLTTRAATPCGGILISPPPPTDTEKFFPRVARLVPNSVELEPGPYTCFHRLLPRKPGVFGRCSSLQIHVTRLRNGNHFVNVAFGIHESSLRSVRRHAEDVGGIGDQRVAVGAKQAFALKRRMKYLLQVLPTAKFQPEDTYNFTSSLKLSI